MPFWADRTPGASPRRAAVAFATGFALLTALMAAPARAEVTANTPQGIAVSHETHVAAAPMAVWRRLGEPASWWNGDHTWSGAAANLSLDTRIGGCFCEAMTGDDGVPGGVRHGTVIHSVPGRLLRLMAVLGPLQSEPLQGTLSVAITPDGTGSKVRFDYLLGGFARTDLTQASGPIDRVIGGALQGLARSFDPAAPR